MVAISEWLPNPPGPDAAGEWVELLNDGPQAVPLRGWRIENGRGKAYAFKNESVPANGFLVLPRSKTGVELRNENETLVLYDASGKEVSRSAFAGLAPEGKSIGRAPGAEATVLMEPTPGAPNAPVSFLMGDRIPGGFHGGGFAVILIGTAAALTLAGMYVLINNEYLAHLFFNRDAPPGPQGGGGA